MPWTVLHNIMCPGHQCGIVDGYNILNVYCHRCGMSSCSFVMKCVSCSRVTSFVSSWMYVTCLVHLCVAVCAAVDSAARLQDWARRTD